jgi:hypothetical protein
MRSSPTRRHLVGALTATVLAGCSAGDDGPDPSDTDASTTRSTADATTSAGTAGPEPTSAGTAGPEPTSAGTAGSGAGPDLREANVTAVAVSTASDGVRFDVTLYHDDAGESGYANWWVVETRGGEELGRRDLAHSHGTREFTRSATVSVPEAFECVVVRGHDQTHGYGGRAALVNLDSGAMRIVEQGGERQSFDAGDCP